MFTKLQPFFFSDFVDLTDPFDRMVVPRQASQHECSPQLSVSEPSTSIENDEKELRLSLDLPGVKASDLKIDVDKNILQISGYRQHSSSSQGQAIRKRRRISYSVQLDDGIDVAKIKAITCQTHSLFTYHADKITVTPNWQLRQTPSTYQSHQH